MEYKTTKRGKPCVNVNAKMFSFSATLMRAKIDVLNMFLIRKNFTNDKMEKMMRCRVCGVDFEVHIHGPASNTPHRYFILIGSSLQMKS